jgi:hypothetical protein
MRWIRAKQRLGGQLALFALALQLFLSFGHIHREDIYGPFYASSHAATDQKAPSGGPSQHRDDYCEICATISLLSSSFVAQAPQLLPLQRVWHSVEHADRVLALSIAPRRASFQSRAPPAA